MAYRVRLVSKDDVGCENCLHKEANTIKTCNDLADICAAPPKCWKPDSSYDSCTVSNKN
jgi:hypothetical protein